MTHRPPFPVAVLDYELPAELIAQSPPPRREEARMLVVDRATDSLRGRGVTDLPELFRPGDLLVLNDTRVLPAKLTLNRATGGVVQGLFLEEPALGTWRLLLDKSRRLRIGEALTPEQRPAGAVRLTLRERLDEGQWIAAVEPPAPAETILNDIGTTPLPPYIHRKPGADDAHDRQRYQTIFARRPGAVAAPTAGFHLTESILTQIRARGVEVAAVTLHIGLGTFKPVAVNDLSQHVMHTERYELPAETAQSVNRCKSTGGRVVAVGTTSVRVLEAAAHAAARPLTSSSPPSPGSSAPSSPRPFVPLSATAGATDLLIYPPYPFRVVDALLTNFHLPRSTLLALVMAFAGIEATRRAYTHAITGRYRFYSFGDAMWIA